jgi:hypothetical protein
LIARVPGFGGYGALDARRTDDDSIRAHGGAQLDWVARALADADLDPDERGEHAELVTQIELVREELRLADRGYREFFSQPKLEGGLDLLYARDERWLEQVEELAEQVASGELSPGKLRGSVRRLRLALAARRNAILALSSP